jgi:hypothetical protein
VLRCAMRKGLMDVDYQKGEEPSPDNPNAKGYTELKKVYDMAGNDPSKPGQALSNSSLCRLSLSSSRSNSP